MTYPIPHFLHGRRDIAPPYNRVMIAKTTQLGDLVISLPMAGALKRRDPGCTVILLTHPNTADAARCCPDVDEVHAEPATAQELLALLIALKIDIFIQVSPARELAQAAHDAAIPQRIGTLSRGYNWRLCTHLVAITDTFSGLNKRLLDLQYLTPLGIRVRDLAAVRDLYHLRPPAPTPAPPHPADFARGRNTIILSPALITAKAHRWPLEFYSRLIRQLDPARFHWFICGVASERQGLLPLLASHLAESNVTDLVGQLPLAQFSAFVALCDGLVAGSTGPLHLAAALGIRTLGLYQSRRGDLRRWQPVGGDVTVLHSATRCHGEPRPGNARHGHPCPCILALAPERVAGHVQTWFDTGAEPGPLQKTVRQA